MPHHSRNGAGPCGMNRSPSGRSAVRLGILTALGVSSKALRNKHGPCPMCGGKDRFRFDNKGGRGTWICSQCGAGDGVELVKRLLNADFKEAVKAIDQHLGSAPAAPPKGNPGLLSSNARK